ncbi:MAG TPA: hypothetical protein VI072_34515, partial [Polyangiaceae bacterium]
MSPIAFHASDVSVTAMSPEVKRALVVAMSALWVTWAGYKFITRGVFYGDYKFGGTLLVAMYVGLVGGATMLVRHYPGTAKRIVLVAAVLVIPAALYSAIDTTSNFERVYNLSLSVVAGLATWHLVFRAKLVLILGLLAAWFAWTGYKFMTRGVAYGDYRFAGTMLVLMWSGFAMAAAALARHRPRLANGMLLFSAVVVVPGAVYSLISGTRTNERAYNLLLAIGVVVLTWYLVFRLKLSRG